MGKKYEFTVDGEQKAAAFLATAVAGLSRAKADILVKSGEVRVNGARIKSNAVLHDGDTVTVFVPDGMGRDVQLKIIYDDENIVVFDKPKRTAYDALPHLYGSPLFAVHRLDTNTTGVIAFAKTEHALAELTAAFRERRVSKLYEAVVSPAPAAEHAVLTAYMKLLRSQNTVVVSAQPKPGYKTMTTEYEVTERIGDAAVLRVQPHTGRTHQIRAHLSFIGCPIIGEHKYFIRGGAAFEGAPDTQMLAAVELAFFGLKGKLAYLNGKKFCAPSGFDLEFLRGGRA